MKRCLFLLLIVFLFLSFSNSSSAFVLTRDLADPSIYIGGKWGVPALETSASVTWSFALDGSGDRYVEDHMTWLDYESIIGSAFQSWEDATNSALSFTFLETGSSGAFDAPDDGIMGDIRFFMDDNVFPALEFSDPGVLAASVAPPSFIYDPYVPDPFDINWWAPDSAYGDIFFDHDVNWGSYTPFGLSAEETLFLVSLHEIGHAIGLQHVDFGAIMNPHLNNYAVFDGLQDDDIAGVQALYGYMDDPGNGTSVPEPSTVLLLGMSLLVMGVCSRRKIKG